jgi:sulfate adenylyltransferase
LTGFLTRDDYQAVVCGAHLAGGLPWSIPVTLAVAPEQAQGLEGREAALRDASGTVRAVLSVQEVFPYDKQTEAREVYRTTDPSHPGVAALLSQGDLLLGGPVQVLSLPEHADFPERYLTPAQTRQAFSVRGWRTVAGFQTRNPIHRAHEYLLRVALELTDGLLVHPLVGETKSDDIPADVRMRCYTALLDNYFPADRVLLSVNPASMRYAGPREAVFHALIRKNYGCTHFIVGRDHAGVGQYYGTYDAQRYFDEFDAAALGIVPLKFENSFWCRKVGGMATRKTSSSGPEDQISLSGTAVRDLLKRGELPPAEFTRPEVAKELIAWAQAQP